MTTKDRLEKLEAQWKQLLAIDRFRDTQHKHIFISLVFLILDKTMAICYESMTFRQNRKPMQSLIAKTV